MSKHTPEPWSLRDIGDYFGVYSATANRPVARIERASKPDAERIVACVNACEGISDPASIPAAAAVLRVARALLIRLGDTAGNGPKDPTNPDSLGLRCDAIGLLNAALAGLGADA